MSSDLELRIAEAIARSSSLAASVTSSLSSGRFDGEDDRKAPRNLETRQEIIVHVIQEITVHATICGVLKDKAGPRESIKKYRDEAR